MTLNVHWVTLGQSFTSIQRLQWTVWRVWNVILNLTWRSGVHICSHTSIISKVRFFYPVDSSWFHPPLFQLLLAVLLGLHKLLLFGRSNQVTIILQPPTEHLEPKMIRSQPKLLCWKSGPQLQISYFSGMFQIIQQNKKSKGPTATTMNSSPSGRMATKSLGVVCLGKRFDVLVVRWRCNGCESFDMILTMFDMSILDQELKNGCILHRLFENK